MSAHENQNKNNSNNDFEEKNGVEVDPGVAKGMPRSQNEPSSADGGAPAQTLSGNIDEEVVAAQLDGCVSDQEEGEGPPSGIRKQRGP